ncbi:hypothetical protein [Planctomicrobium piriforme]|uniref:Uncharacterized protein n=1 Tax=Planctomicrobium piriforme TaxID=1576369 RepID=A0A1I3RYD5_9PLAN|nr:hypothetical protein [Planctomicrobium piriforme]SFJ51613.1 hypothetical protein SAMN05421753_12251 [Planctomicrobium piriforme]
MTQHELNAAVASATGEDLSEIRRRGFSIADSRQCGFDPEPDRLIPQMIDWDDAELRRNVPVPHRGRRWA